MSKVDTPLAKSLWAAPSDNAQAKWFIKTVTAKEVHLSEYQTQREKAQQRIERFSDDVYNRRRLH